MLFGLILQAQLAPNSISPNFALQDIAGVNHVLYSELDAGKTVVLAAFDAADLVSSWNYLPGLNTANDALGQNGDNSVFFLAIETTDVPNSDLTDPTVFGTSWMDQLNFPIVNNSGTFANDFLIGASFPYVYVITPNRIANTLDAVAILDDPVGIISAAADPANYNNLVPAGTNNIGVLSYEGAADFCQTIAPSFKIQNLGTEPAIQLTSFTATLFNNNSPVQVLEWTGVMTPYTIETLDFNPVESDDDLNLKLVLSLPNGVADEFSDNNEFTVSVGAVPNIGTSSLEMNLTTDNSSSEFTWRVENSTGSIVYQNGTLQNNTDYNETFNFANDGCYTFIMEDLGGDGLTGSGSISLTFNGTTIPVTANFGQLAEIGFEVETPVQNPPQIEVVANINGLGLFTANVVTQDDVASYDWTFGDGGTGMGQSVEHQYGTEGQFTITVTATGTNGLVTTETVMIAVTFPEEPTSATAAFTVTQTPGSNQTILIEDNSTFAQNYTWNFGDGTIVTVAEPGSYTYAENGTFMICLEVNNNEVDTISTACETITVTDVITGLDELNELNNLKVYPTLAKNLVTIEYSLLSQTEKLSLDIYDQSGRLVQNIPTNFQNIGLNRLNLNVVDFNAGLYFVKVANAQGGMVQKFIVQ